MSHRRRSAALLSWYRGRRRPFPWRDTRDPWALLVVEVMSQQTQIGRVVARWEAWMRRFPDPAACAEAPTHEVLALWSGLGYNARAIRLQRAAADVTGNGWPTTVDGLRALPGVGPYTAAAVACQAFGVQVPTVDTNHRRVISRWLGEPLDGRSLDAAAHRLLPPGRAEDWNQALMDLGALVCLPKPACDTCPVARWCAAPDVYAPPPSQARYAGSSRQVRGDVLKALLAGPAAPEQLTELTGHPHDRVTQALAGLAADGLVSEHGDGWTAG